MSRYGVPRSVGPMTSRPKIIVGIDGSSRGDDALKFASVLANAVGSGLLLVHACVPGEDRQTARGILDSHRATVERVPVELVACADASPARALDRVAAAHHAAVIVVGPSHRAGLGLVLPGSTGQQLLQITRRTVAVVPRGWRPKAKGTLRRIGCGYGPTPQSEAALETAAELTRMLGGELDVMRAFWSTRPSGGMAMAVSADLQRRAQASLGQVVQDLPEGLNAHAKLLFNDPATALIARSRDLDLLVVGSRAKGPLGAIWSGSVSNRVIREAACPVVVVPRGVIARLTEPTMARSA
jgi:nucleotide-binding universal stress UspA family protein